MSDGDSIRIKCPNCGATAKGSNSHLKQNIKCPKCEELVQFELIDSESPSVSANDSSIESTTENKTLIHKYEEDYKTALKVIDTEVPALIEQHKEMKAIILFGEQLALLNEVHESLHNFYSIIYSYQSILEKFGSVRMRQLGHELKATREILIDSDSDFSQLSTDSLDSIILEDLAEVGFEKEHWYIRSSVLTEIEYMIETLKILIEPDFIPLEEKDDSSSEEKPSRYIPSEVKIAVWRRDQGKCVDCASKEKLEYDHIIPVSKGGSNTERNIQLLCETCNRKKSATIQ